MLATFVAGKTKNLQNKISSWVKMTNDKNKEEESKRPMMTSRFQPKRCEPNIRQPISLTS